MDIQTNRSTDYYYLTDFWADYGDPRTAPYPFMSTLKLPLIISTTYLLFVLYLGPMFMQNRKPFSLKTILIPYNLLLSAFNVFILVKFSVASEWGKRLFDVDFSTRETYQETPANITLGYLYMISKYVDMLDTIFFVLRKKSNQISGLHVYHHSVVPLMGWLYYRTHAVHVNCYVFAILNAPIHAVMYAYYGLAAIGPHMQPYLWWKRYITQIQITQFALLFLYGIYFISFQRGYHFIFSIDIIVQSCLYMILFSRFYFGAYVDKEAMRKKVE